MLNKLSVTQKGVLLVLLPVAFELLFVALLSYNLYQARSTYQTVQQERDTLLLLHKIHVSTTRTALLVFTPHTTADKILPVLKAQLDQIKSVREALSRMSTQSQEVAEVVGEFEKQMLLIDQVFNRMHTVMSNQFIGMSERARYIDPVMMMSMISENRKLTKRLDKLESDFEKRGPERLKQVRKELTIFLILGISVGAIISFLLSRMFSRDITSRLRNISLQAQRFFEGKPLQEPVSGSDEIAQLDKTFYVTAESLRQIRLREQAILANAADVICSLDSKYRFVGVSAVAEKCWGKTEADLLGAPISNLVSEDSLDATFEALKKISGEGKGEFENRILLPSGGFADFHWSVRFNESEKRYFCTVHDVTEIRAVERLKAKFLSIVSHDLRAPITSVGISLNILSEGKRGELPDKALAVLGKAESSLSTLTVLVNELLDLDKLEAGKMSLNSSAVNANQICRNTGETLSNLAESANISLQITDVDCILWGDVLRLTQALNNLVSNAIKFSPANSTVKIDINLTKEFAEICVIDQGPGIADADKQTVFDKFKQTSVKSNLQGKSSGLGLTIVRAIVEAHNGTVGVRDGESGGSVFYMRLPRLTGSLEDDDL